MDSIITAKEARTQSINGIYAQIQMAAMIGKFSVEISHILPDDVTEKLVNDGFIIRNYTSTQTTCIFWENNN